jgi:hypothetical protein
MFHRHIDDHMEAGMSAPYKVEPRRSAAMMIEFAFNEMEKPLRPYEVFVQNSIPRRFVL